MIRIQFNQQDVQALRYERFHHPSVRVQLKMEALYLKSKGLPHHEICRICEISKPTLITYLKEYKRGGIKQLKDKREYQAGENHLSIRHSGVTDIMSPGSITNKMKKEGALSPLENVA